MKATFPPAYAEALEALRACARAFTPERYAVAARALAKCWEADATSAMEPETALRANIRIANDNTLMRLAGKVDALHKAWKASA